LFALATIATNAKTGGNRQDRLGLLAGSDSAGCRSGNRHPSRRVQRGGEKLVRSALILKRINFATANTIKRVNSIASEQNEAMAPVGSAAIPIFELGKQQMDMALGLQKEFLDACDQASRNWIARVKSEAELWSDLAVKLARTHSVPDAMRLYQECLSQRIKMAADDAQRASIDCGSLVQRINRSMTNGWPTGGT
jgi:hypothetical protein